MNSGPKSFKNMSFPPPRCGTTTAVYAPLPKPPPTRVITPTEQERRALQLKEMKLFINNQKCPMCGAQLDGPIGYDKATVFCRSGGEKEYKAHYKYGMETPYWSVSTFYTTHFAFEVENTHLTDELFKNIIYKIDLSLNERFQQREKKEILNYEGERLLLKGGLTEERLLEKIKLYTLFS